MSAATRENPPDPRAESSYGPTPATPGGGADQPAPAATSSGEVQRWRHPDGSGDRPTVQPRHPTAHLEDSGGQPGTTSTPARLPEVLTAREAAAILRVGRNQLYQAVARGEIPALRIGRTIRIPTTALLDLLAAQPGQPATTARPDQLAPKEER